MKLPLTIILFSLATVCRSQDYDIAKVMEMEMHTIKTVYARFPLQEHHNIPADTELIGIWKMKEDVDKHDYFVLERLDYNTFVFTYMDRGGSNRRYENWDAFFSKIGDATFLNVRYRRWDTRENGYFFLKVTEIDPRGWEIDLALVADTTLKDIPDAKGVSERIAKNVNNPAYFKPAVHFHKILPLMYCK